MPLSISNSDIPYRDIPNQPWLKILAVSFLLLVLAMIAWESLSRSMHHTTGTYLSGFEAMWADERRKLDTPNNDIRVVLTGSSRILWASDLDIMETHLGTRPLQLALPGTSPAIFVEDIVNNTEFDGLIIVGVTPFLFNWMTEGYFGGPALERLRNELPSQWSGTKLHEFLNEYFAFLDEGFSLFELVDHYTYASVPERAGSKNLSQQGWKLGNVYADRQTDMWSPIEERGSFDNIQITNFWTPGIDLENIQTPEELTEMSVAAVSFFEPVIAKLRARGGDIIFIRMPSEGLYKELDTASNHRENLWAPMIEGFNSPAINSMDYPELSSELDIPEWSHLSRDSQDLWSARIVPFIEKAYRDSRGKNLYDLLNK